MDKIIFFHMNQLGDLLFSLPVLKAAKEETGAEIISIVKPSLSPLLSESGIVNKVIPKEKSVFKLISKLKQDKGGKAVFFSESPSSVIAAYFAGIKERTGFETASLSFLLTKKAKRSGVPSLANNKELGKAAGFKNIQADYTGMLKIPEQNIKSAAQWFAENQLDPSKTIAVSAGASKNRQDKCLESQKWAEVIDSLSEKGINCVLSGAVWEKESMQKLSAVCKSKPKIFSAEKGILDSAAFLKACSLFLGIDSGAMHLAAALGTRCAGLFGNTDPMQIGPMPLSKHIIIKKNSMSEITAEEVIKALPL